MIGRMYALYNVTFSFRQIDTDEFVEKSAILMLIFERFLLQCMLQESVLSIYTPKLFWCVNISIGGPLMLKTRLSF